MRFIFIADKSKAYTSFERDRILEEWNVERAETRVISKIDEAGIASLFGPPPVSILELEDKDSIRDLLEKLKAASEADIKRYSTPGTIVHTNIDRTSTRSLEKEITKIGGFVKLSKGGANETPASKLVDELAISSDGKQFLKEYAGDNYSSILGIVKTVGALSLKQQKNITIQDLIIRIPTPPGGIPPWEIEPAMLRGDITKAIELYRRVAETSHLLVVLSILKGKFRLIYKVASMLDENPRMTTAAISQALSPAPVSKTASKELNQRIKKATVADNYPLKLALGTAKKIKLAKATRIIEIMAETERKVKGGASGDPHIHMEQMLIQVTALVSK